MIPIYPPEERPVTAQETNEPIRILYTPVAWAKMTGLIFGFTTEIAWHGLVTRKDRDFVVYDIITHEQTVSGASVTTSDEEQTRFYCELPVEQLENLHMQGHSHVNMPVFPSATDEVNQKDVVEIKGSRKHPKFQIFQIWNRQLQCHSRIYDFTANAFYGTEEIVTDVLLDADAEEYMSTFMNSARAMVKVLPKNPVLEKMSVGWAEYPDDYDDESWNEYEDAQKGSYRELELTGGVLCESE